MNLETDTRGFFYGAMASFIELFLFLVVILIIYLVFKLGGGEFTNG